MLYSIIIIIWWCLQTGAMRTQTVGRCPNAEQRTDSTDYFIIFVCVHARLIIMFADSYCLQERRRYVYNCVYYTGGWRTRWSNNTVVQQKHRSHNRLPKAAHVTFASTSAHKADTSHISRAYINMMRHQLPDLGFDDFELYEWRLLSSPRVEINIKLYILKLICNYLFKMTVFSHTTELLNFRGLLNY